MSVDPTPPDPEHITDEFWNRPYRLALKVHWAHNRGQDIPPEPATPPPARKVYQMADYMLPNDVIRIIPIVAETYGGAIVPLPDGGTLSITNSDTASLNAVISGTDLVLNALKALATGITVTVSYGMLNPAVLVLDIVADTTPVALVLQTSLATDQPQAVPAS